MKLNRKIYMKYILGRRNDDELGDYEYNYTIIAKVDEKKVKFDQYEINDNVENVDSYDNDKIM